MIEEIQGVLSQKQATFVIINCNGIGYGIQVSARTSEVLPDLGTELKLLTKLVVREDSMTLYGFMDAIEKELFLNLIEVSGIGPKTTQRILSDVSPNDFLSYIALEDKNSLNKIKGIGKKTAELLLINLKDKALKLASINEENSIVSTVAEEAIAALNALGVKGHSAQKAVEKAIKALPKDSSISQIITESLKHT